MTRKELEMRVRRLSDVPDNKFINEVCTLWNEIVPMFISERHRYISECGTFIYWSPHEPVTQTDKKEPPKGAGNSNRATK